MTADERLAALEQVVQEPHDHWEREEVLWATTELRRMVEAMRDMNSRGRLSIGALAVLEAFEASANKMTNRDRSHAIHGTCDFETGAHFGTCDAITEALDEAEQRGRDAERAQLDEAVGLLRKAHWDCRTNSVDDAIGSWLAAYDAREAAKKGVAG